jgi:hypothetical protein
MNFALTYRQHTQKKLRQENSCARGPPELAPVFFYRGDIAKRGDIAIGLAAIANV